MSGHSKWSKVKHQKEGTDAQKGKLFTKLAHAIALAVSGGDGNADPQTNGKLRFAIEKALGSNMSKEKIERAIEQGRGGQSDRLVEVLYEAFAPGGVGVLIRAATDNKNRTVSAIKNILEKGGGILAGSGAVSHLFTLVGKLRVTTPQRSESFIADIMECDVLDMKEEKEGVWLFTNHDDVQRVKETLSQKGYAVLEAELFYRPNMIVPVTDPVTSQRLLLLISSLEEHDDVLTIYTNHS